MSTFLNENGTHTIFPNLNIRGLVCYFMRSIFMDCEVLVS
jgi:hypothetical protein